MRNIISLNLVINSSIFIGMSGGKVTDLTKGIVGDSDWIRRWQMGETGWHHESADP